MLAQVIDLYGDPGAIRTHDPQLRRLVLYPAELPGHSVGASSPRWPCGLARADDSRTRRDRPSRRRLQTWWDVEDLNLRPPRCEHGALAS